MLRAEMSPIKITVVLIGLLAMLEPSLQLTLKNPMPLFSRTTTQEEPRAFGLVTNSRSAEKALLESREFIRGAEIKIHGRTFVTGRIHGGEVVLVRSSGEPSVNLGITVQILIDNFVIGGIIHLGNCGGLDRSLEIGSVAIPAHVAFTGNWDWLSMRSNEPGQLQFGQFNDPDNGENRMGSLKYKEIDIYHEGKTLRSYWIYATRNWLNYARRVKIDSGEVRVGMNASSSDVYVKNNIYGDFIAELFGAKIVDTVSVAAGLGAKINDVHYISIQGISNYNGENDNSELASQNVAKAVIEFIRQATVPRSAADV